MKIAITGHSKGIGKACYDILEKDNEVIGFSRSNGYDITENFHAIVHAVKNCDVFINNAWHNYIQIDLLNAIFNKWKDNFFDLVISINTLHCLEAHNLEVALKEMERVGKQHKYLCVESYRNEQEKANLLYWQVSCEAFNTPREWQWWFEHTGYTGDHSFIYFE